MDFASPSIFKQELDPLMIEQIDTLRTIRLNLAETMLKDLPRTFDELIQRGLIETVAEIDELRRELTTKINLLRARLQNPSVVYDDELSLYLDLVESADDIEGEQ